MSDVREAANGNDTTTELAQNVGEKLQAVRQRVSDATSDLEPIDRQLRTFVRERPFVAVAGAVIAGYLLGRLLQRSHG